MIVVYQISRKGGRTVKKILKFIKKNWISVSLNDTLSDEFIQSLIDSSYNETVGKQVKKAYPRKKKRP